MRSRVIASVLNNEVLEVCVRLNGQQNRMLFV